MHVFIFASDVMKFEDFFEEGSIYIIDNFSVREYNKDIVKCIRNNKQISLSQYTRVSHCLEDDGLILKQYFDFEVIGNIPNLINDPGYKQQLIGKLVYVFFFTYQY